MVSKDKIGKIDLENNFVRVNVEDIGASDLVDLRKDLEKKSPSTLEIIATESKKNDPCDQEDQDHGSHAHSGTYVQ